MEKKTASGHSEVHTSSWVHVSLCSLSK